MRKRPSNIGHRIIYNAIRGIARNRKSVTVVACRVVRPLVDSEEKHLPCALPAELRSGVRIEIYKHIRVKQDENHVLPGSQFNRTGSLPASGKHFGPRCISKGDVPDISSTTRSSVEKDLTSES